VKNKPSSVLKSIAYKKNIPLTVIWELTRRCNLNCRHCYIPASDRKEENELPFTRIKKILKELASMGSMYLIFTGGEVFLRRDTLDIISYAARQLGFDVRVFTNGVLIDESLAPEIRRAGVSAVELSLYGPPKIHDAITGMRFSFEKTTRAIEILQKEGIRVIVKTPFMKINFPSRRWIEKFTTKRGILWQIDPMVSYSEDGNRKNESLRLGARQLITLHKEYARLIYSRQQQQEKETRCETDPGYADPDYSGEKLIYCGAGRSFAAISPDGTLYPCLQLRIPLGNLKKDNFRTLWHPPETASSDGNNDKKLPMDIHFLRKALLPADSACSDCRHLNYCPRCPGVALVEEGDIFASPRTSSCLLAIARSKIFRH